MFDFLQFIKSEKGKNSLFFFGAILLLLIGKYNHEPWRDEWHAWMIVQHAQSWQQLFLAKCYEGHPNFYFSILYIIKNIWNSEFAFIFSHIIPAIGSFYLLFYKLSFTTIQKVFILFNYYFLFEFGIINRVYVWLIFISLLIVVCIHNKNLFLSLVGIFILCSIHLQALPLVAFFAGILSIRIAHQHWIFNKNTFLIFLFSIGSILFGIWQAQTEPTTMHNQSWQSINWLRAIPIALANQCKAFCPVPNFTSSHVWNTLLLDIPFVLLYSIFFVVVFIIFYNWHWRDKLIFCIAVVVNVLLLAYFNGWGIRHGCFLWLLVFFGFCLQSSKSKWANYLITIILAIQAIAGCILFYLDAIHPFSSSKHVGDFIKKNYSKSYVIGAHHYTIEPISFYLQQPIYHLTVHKQVYQLQWKEENFTNNFSYAEIDSIVKHNPNTICILSKAIPDSLKNAIIKSPACNFNSILVFSAPNSIVKDESYEIWKLNAKIP